MRHVAIVILLGLLAGLVSHLAWFGFRRPVASDTPANALAWLQQDLALDDAQFARLKAIHESSGPQLQELAVAAARMRAEFAAFERRRQTDGEIDFLAFARYVEEQRTLDRVCSESTRRLIAAAAGVMTPAQRARYLDRFSPAMRSPTDRLN